MRTRHIAPLLFARRVTARRPRELEMVAIVRGTFDLVQGGPMTFVEGPPLLAQGMLHGDDEHVLPDGRRALRYGSDFADFKLNAEVLFRGACHPPDGPATHALAALHVGSWSMVLEVTGRRVFLGGPAGGLSKPHAFSSIPIDSVPITSP